MLPLLLPVATGAILILDRERLRNRYKLAPYHDSIYEDDPMCSAPRQQKTEEMIGVPAIGNLKCYILM